MTLDDVPAVNALEHRLFPVDAWPLHMFFDELSQPDTRRYLVAETAGGIVGYAGLMCIEPIADVQTIAVVPEFEGRGHRLGTADPAHRGGRTARRPDVLLEVRADNPRAQQLYLRFGFEQIHVRRRYYRDGVDALIMRLQLRHPGPGPTTRHGSRPAMNRQQPLVLGIESSCDETGVGIVRGTALLTNTVSSSMDEHVRFGGVIPEIASRAHLDAFVPTLRQALATPAWNLDDIDAIAVTSGPGLAGALMVGVCAAKALAVATGKPLYAINHLVAHVGVGLLDGQSPAGASGGAGSGVAPRLPENLGALLVSGGHTEILKINSITDDVRAAGLHDRRRRRRSLRQGGPHPGPRLPGRTRHRQAGPDRQPQSHPVPARTHPAQVHGVPPRNPARTATTGPSAA